MGPVAMTPCEAESVDDDLDRIQGTWVVVAVHIDGKEIFPTLGSVRMPIVTIENQHLKMDIDDLSVEYRFSLTSQKGPDDATRWWGHFDGTKSSIISVAGWYLYQPAGNDTELEYLAISEKQLLDERPGKFASDTFRFVMVRTPRSLLIDSLTSSAAEKIRDEQLAPFGGLQGSWQLVKANYRNVTDEIVHSFEKDYFVRRLTIEVADEQAVMEAKVILDTTRSPNHIDLVYAGVGTLKGLVQIEPDRLLVCTAGFGFPRPTTLAPDDGKKAELHEYRRWDAQQVEQDTVATAALFAPGSQWIGQILTPQGSPRTVTLKIESLKRRRFQGKLHYDGRSRAEPTQVEGTIRGSFARFSETDGRTMIHYRGPVVNAVLEGEYGVGVPIGSPYAIRPPTNYAAAIAMISASSCSDHI